MRLDGCAGEEQSRRTTAVLREKECPAAIDSNVEELKPDGGAERVRA
jgi:hypothetical protein